MSAERILFLSPCVPRPGGNGLAMRAHAVSEALRELGRVEIFVRPVWPVSMWIGTHLPWLWQLGRLSARDWPWVKRGLPVSGEFSRVHVFRMAMVPWAVEFLGRVACDLDLDESEVQARGRIAALYRRKGAYLKAWTINREAEFYEAREREWLPRFRRVYASSTTEMKRLESQYPALPLVLLPNTVSVAAPKLRARSSKFRILFVGTLNHYPNADAAEFLVAELAPLLDPTRFEICIAGSGGGRRAWLKRLLSPGATVRWLGFVEDLEELYAATDAVVVPIRAGGGTRIKILEALAYGLPVVSTSVGMEGLLLEPNRDILVSETAVEFASACEMLRTNVALARDLGERGRRVVSRSYSKAALTAALGLR